MKPYIVDASAVCLIHGEILTTSWKSDNCSRQLSNVSNSNIKRFFQTDLQNIFSFERGRVLRWHGITSVDNGLLKKCFFYWKFWLVTSFKVKAKICCGSATKSEALHQFQSTWCICSSGAKDFHFKILFLI